MKSSNDLCYKWLIERGGEVIERVALPEPTGFDAPDRLDAFLDAVRRGPASTAGVRNILGQDRFPKRVPEVLEVDYPAEKRRIDSALTRCAELRHANTADHAEKFATGVVLMTLKKPLFSSPVGALHTLEQHKNSLKSARKRKGVLKPTRGILEREIDRVEEDYSVNDEAKYEAIRA